MSLLAQSSPQCAGYGGARTPIPPLLCPPLPLTHPPTLHLILNRILIQTYNAQVRVAAPSRRMTPPFLEHSPPAAAPAVPGLLLYYYSTILLYNYYTKTILPYYYASIPPYPTRRAARFQRLPERRLRRRRIRPRRLRKRRLRQRWLHRWAVYVRSRGGTVRQTNVKHKRAPRIFSTQFNSTQFNSTHFNPTSIFVLYSFSTPV